MVETAIYVLLGALATALLALLALPAVSRRAFRLAEARLRLTAPLSAAQAQADRDALRGRHAVEIALVERRAEQAGERWSQAQIALGRQAAEIVQRDAALAERAAEIARLRGEIAGLESELRGRDVELGAAAVAMRDFLAQRETAEARLAEAHTLRGQLEARIEALASELNLTQRRAESARLAGEARAAELELRLDEARSEATRLKRQAAELSERLRDRVEDADLREKELSVRIESLVAAQAETETALRAARATGDADERLRQTIARLGREMVASRAETLAQGAEASAD